MKIQNYETLEFHFFLLFKPYLNLLWLSTALVSGIFLHFSKNWKPLSNDMSALSSSIALFFYSALSWSMLIYHSALSILSIHSALSWSMLIYRSALSMLSFYSALSQSMLIFLSSLSMLSFYSALSRSMLSLLSHFYSSQICVIVHKNKKRWFF